MVKQYVNVDDAEGTKKLITMMYGGVEDITSDPTLPRTLDTKCEECGHFEAVFFQARSRPGIEPKPSGSRSFRRGKCCRRCGRLHDSLCVRIGTRALGERVDATLFCLHRLPAPVDRPLGEESR
jgi:DNA-directed RNA polymerase subunit M/transcription elongation factor TFIIS